MMSDESNDGDVVFMGTGNDSARGLSMNHHKKNMAGGGSESSSTPMMMDSKQQQQQSNAGTLNSNSEMSKRSYMSHESWENVASLSSYPMPRCDSPFRKGPGARMVVPMTTTTTATTPSVISTQTTSFAPGMMMMIPPPAANISFPNNSSNHHNITATDTIGSNLSSINGLTINSFPTNFSIGEGGTMGSSINGLTVGSFPINNLTVGEGSTGRGQGDISKKMPSLMDLFIPPKP